MNRSMAKRFIITVGLSLAMNANCLAASQTPWVLNHETYLVQAEDTIESIAQVYMEKNTYGQREQKEFISGIEQLNPWLLDRGISSGDKIEVNFWSKS